MADKLTMSSELKKLSILLADDSADDRFFMKRLLSHYSGLKVSAEVRDGEEAISYLKGEGKFSDRTQFPFPDVLLLDLKMPRKTGYEVLEWLRSSSFNGLPVFVITGSILEEDKNRCLELGATAFCSKSITVKNHDHIIQILEKWRQAQN